ncbi:ADP-heptose:LPS heptosyltransferase [Pontibacter ummariensis]|uniref:ADP-heptose:LPS heptosyltransferase n=1 Tax=Pontibacter ummariensis TaxID=1610492 RepID=A0A239FF56_9BACT|nr:glycosyltransferase family 9 protein [Pontibacter ummariensis]PRY12287.1 ADP-heptose:LPS heptosyltransferase [Pontibacter ummariensis]SNS55395.1 ADP-heptose:LPS heptosyltransferase [Pontibacter ummariensis]
MDRDKSIVPNVKKIAVLRANGLGDFFFVLPALQAIRNAYPQAEIVYLGTQLHYDLLKDRESPVSRVVVVPKAHGIPNEADRPENEQEVEDFFQAMQQEEFDIAMQMHGGGRNSNPFTLKLGARLTAGLKTQNAPPLDRNVPYYLCQNEILRYLEVADRIGARTDDLEPHLEVKEGEKEALLQKYPELKDISYAVIHPGSSGIQRQWPPEKFAAVGDELAAQGLKVVMTGATEQEQEVCARVAQVMKSEVLNLCGKLSVGELPALMEMAEVMVSNDTGPMHVARAVGTPTVGIYWFFNMLTAAPLTVTKNRTCIGWNTCCPNCGTSCFENDLHHEHNGCDHRVSFVDDVTVEDVLEKTFSLLSKGQDVLVESNKHNIL